MLFVEGLKIIWDRENYSGGIKLNHKKIEEKWQRKWKKAEVFQPKVDKKRKKFFFTTPYPYISGSLHIGHGRAVIESDVYCRYKRMKGFNVLYPLAFHITGTPVLGISAAIEKGDKKKIELYKSYVKNYVKEEKEVNRTIESFKEPWNIVNFFIPKMMNEYSSLGLSIDWTRRFTTGDKEYQKFIEWQFRKYKEKDYLVKGSYPVLFCPNCGNAVGEDDIQDADTNPVEKQEFTILKFPLEESDLVLVATTLRPETVYGQTNLWVNPNTEYRIVEVNGEKWVISKEGYEKLSYQKKKLKTVDSIEGTELIGKFVTAPGVNKKIIILPSSFVDVNVGSGIVTSVPSDAPYDWMALKDLQENKEMCERHGLDYSKVKEIKVIPIIKTPKWGDMAGVKISEEMKLKDQNDERLKEATQIIYKEGFHSGVLNENCEKYAGMKVVEAKEKVKRELLKEGKADLFYETSREAYCRDGTKIVVSVLEDQWFLDFNVKGWKEKAEKCLSKMELVPESIRKLFQDTFEWLDKRPATRKRGLGTPLPFDKEWIIESLSDSTIYMSFYVIKNLINKYKIKPEQLNSDFFDYVYLGNGEVKKVSDSTKIKPDILKEFRDDFDYWYPNDHRHTYMAHLSNHLSFFIFAHAGIFPENYWPKKISLHGFVQSEGTKMSKSKGNVITLLDVKNEYGADTLRAYMTTATNLGGTFDWKSKEAENVQKQLYGIRNALENMIKKRKRNKIDFACRAFLAGFEKSVMETEKALEEMRLRDYSSIVVYNTIRNLKKLERKVSKKELAGLYELVTEKWIKLLMPVAPHLAEELWSKLGKKGFVSLEKWPSADKKLIDEKIILTEELIDKTVEDIREIIKIVKKKPKKIHIYVAPEWKHEVYKIVMKIDKNRKKAVSGIMKDTEIRKHGKDAVRFCEELSKNPEKLQEVPNREDEYKAINEATDFIKKEIETEKVYVWKEEDQKKYDPQKKSKNAKPMKPAIYVE